jgi:hypothetical protein
MSARARQIVAVIAVFLVISIGSVFVIPASTCRDGWHSPSIGRPGACSHHGGVDRTWLNFALLLAAAGAAWVGYALRPPSP